MIAPNINLDNLAADLEELAYRITQYLELRDCCDEEDARLPNSFKAAIAQLKTTAMLYTDVVEQGMTVTHSDGSAHLNWVDHQILTVA